MKIKNLIVQRLLFVMFFVFNVEARATDEFDKLRESYYQTYRQAMDGDERSVEELIALVTPNKKNFPEEWLISMEDITIVALQRIGTKTKSPTIIKWAADRKQYYWLLNLYPNTTPLKEMFGENTKTMFSDENLKMMEGDDVRSHISPEFATKIAELQG